jgi:hypothetical protein
MTSPGAGASAIATGDLLEHLEEAGEGNLLRTRSSERDDRSSKTGAENP